MQDMLLQILLCLCISPTWGLIAPVTDLQGEVSLKELTNHVISLENLMSNLTSQVQLLTKQVEAIKTKQDTTVSFKASISGDRTVSVGSTIVFDHVEHNTGSGYNSASGIFRAPISGLFIFSAEVETEDAGGSDYNIIHQGETVASMTVTEVYDTGSMTSIIHVNKGDDVYVKKTVDWGQNARLRGGSWTQFSGHLLKAD